VLFVMPAAFILVMSLALRDTFKPAVLEGVKWRAWDLDGTEASAAFLGGLPERGRVFPAATDSDGWESRFAARAKWVADEADAAIRHGYAIIKNGQLELVDQLAAHAARMEAAGALAEGKIEIAVVIKKGFGAALADVEREGVFVSLEAEPGLPASLVATFRAEAARVLSVERLRVLLGDGWPADAEGRAMSAEKLSGVSMITARHVARTRAKLTLEKFFAEAFAEDAPARAGGADGTEKVAGGADAELTAVQQSVPAWLVFAMFFVVIPLSTIFIAEKQHGTLPRLRSLRVPVSLVALGKVAPFYAVNMAQTLAMLLVGRFVVPWCGGDALSLDVDWAALWVIASAVSLAAIGFALAVASVARTTEQATTAGGVANILLAALGGVMVPRLVMPETMRQLTRFSPMAWGLEGFQDVFVRGAGAGGVLAPAALLLAIGAAGFAVAWWRLRRLA
jgi:ABC-2 type transport system permease protein